MLTRTPTAMIAGRWQRLSDPLARQAVEVWRRRLGVRQPVNLHRISPWQVTGEDGRPGCALIGVVYDERSASICHTRALTIEDIVHELLHVAHPDWSETEVVRSTDEWLRGRRRIRQARLSRRSYSPQGHSLRRIPAGRG